MVAGDFKIKASPTQLFLNTSPVIPNVELVNVHPLIKRLFSKEMLTKAVNIPPAGRISHFLVNWQKLTLNQDILSVVKGYKIPFIKIPFQRKIPNFTKMNKKQIALVDLELKEMLKKGAIMRTQLAQGEFLSSLFLVGKKDGGYCPVINLKMLNQFIPFLHFKLEGLSQLKHIIQEGDWMCKLDLKDAYFSVPLDRNSRKFVRFQWNGTLYEFMCLCFGLGPAPRVFTKLLKLSLLRKINIRVIIYLDDMLILSHTIREAHMSRDTVIYLLQNLGFIINVKKSILHPCQKIEFLGMEIDSIKMTLSLTPEKVQKVVKTCQNLLRSHSTTLLELTRVVGLLSSTIQAVEPAKIQLRFLQQQQIVCLRKKMNYQSVITLNTKSRTE